MTSLHKNLINLAKSFTIIFTLLICLACTNTALEQDQIHLASQAAINLIDSTEIQLKEDTPAKLEQPGKESHSEIPSTVGKPGEALHTETPIVKHPVKEVHTESPAVEKTARHLHEEAPIEEQAVKDLETEVATLEKPETNNILKNHISWTQFFITALGLFILYFLLRFAKQILMNTEYLGNFRLPLLSSIERILIFYEPIVILLLGSAFILINPVFHGMWVVLLLVAGFSHVKNYISGRILQLDKGMAIGNRIKVQNQKGVISAIDRLGVQLTTDKGIQYLNYSKLNDDGFMLLSGEEIGGNYTLKIRPKEYNERLNYPIQLMDLFATTPFLDWSHRPKIGEPSGEQHAMNVKVMVREDSHLQDLLRLIEEQGFVCSVK